MRRLRLIPLLVFLAGLGGTFAVWTLARQDIQRIQQEKFDFRVNEITDNIFSRLQSYEQVLLGVSGLFAASSSVERQEFSTYVDKLRSGKNFPGIQGVGFSLLVPAAEKSRHTEQIRRQGFPDYAIGPAGARETYSAIIYLEPFDWRNQRAFGFDMYSEAVRHAAMRLAWEEGRTAISGKVTLVQETSQGVQFGFLMYAPIYRNGASVNSVEGRRANLLGWTYAPFRMNDLMKGILGKQYGEIQAAVDLEIYDGDGARPEALMYGSNTTAQGNEAYRGAFHASRKIEFGKRQWTVSVRSLPEFESKEANARSSLIGLVGITISLLAALTIWLLLSGRARALVLAEKMTARLREGEAELRKLSGLNQAILDSANYTLISTDTGGTIRTFNAAAERMLGYRAEEVVARTTPTLFHDAQEVAQQAEKLSRELGVPVAAGFETLSAKARLGQVDEREWRYIRKDGSQFPVLLSVTALRGENGEITGYLGVGQNIAESKHNRQQLLKLSRAIEQSPISVLITDMHGAIEYVNPKFCQASGYSAAELLGRNPRILNSGNTPPEIYRELWTTILSGGEWQGELLNRKKTGELYWEKIVVSGLRNEDGNVTSFIGVKEDITARKNAERDIQRFQNILDNTLDMIFMFDPETLRFIYLNKGTVASLGYTRDELLNMHVWEIKPQMPEQVFRSHVAPLLNGDSPWLNYETLHRRKDGSELPVEVFLQLVEEAGGKRLFVAISRDLTERRKIDKLKSEFISTVSHELRTPLTSIRGALGLVRGGVAGELPAQAKPMIEIAYNNAERLVRLINDILDMEKIEAGKMHFEMKELELMPLIEQALEANHAYGEQYRVRFTLVGELPGAKVNMDSDRFLQVMANLLSNAAKFSPPGDEVVVTVKAAGAMVKVAVTDHGGGIPEEFRGRIFQKFSQADSSDTKQKGGTGLGLNITKAIVEKMGGVIGFDSTPGQGTTFYFELPHADARDKVQHQFAVSLLPRILICEDDREMAAQLREMMVRRGYRVDVAGSAEEAKAMLAGQHYHAMTLDISLPGQDGLSLVRELQADEKSAGLPILMISAKASAERERAGDGLEVLDWLDKPVRPDKVFAALREQTANVVGLPVILHVEDDADIRQVVKTLVGEKSDVIAAPTLAVARKLLEGRHFDLVILDIGLPDGSGLDLLALMADKKMAIPVLIFSAHEIDSNLALEVDAALVKSRTSNQCLLDTIMTVIAKHERKEK